MSRILDEGEIKHSTKFFDRFEWTIHDFFDRDVGTCVESPDFLYEGVVWHLAIGTRGNASSPSVFLNLWRSRSSGCRYSVRAGVKNKNGRDCTMVGCETDTDGFLEVRKFLPWAVQTPACNDKRTPKGRLTIFCELYAVVKGGKMPKLTDTATSLLLQNLKDLYRSGLNSDVEMNVEGKVFKAHKAILGARCPVFASMFQHDMQEKSSGAVDIPDCSADAFGIFLRYLYTGEADECGSGNVCDLYYIADKYDVPELKAHCLKFMKFDLSVDSFCDLVALSLRHNESELLQAAAGFFSQNVKLIIKTPRWQRYLSENPIHANELYIKAIDA